MHNGLHLFCSNNVLLSGARSILRGNRLPSYINHSLNVTLNYQYPYSYDFPFFVPSEWTVLVHSSSYIFEHLPQVTLLRWILFSTTITHKGGCYTQIGVARYTKLHLERGLRRFSANAEPRFAWQKKDLGRCPNPQGGLSPLTPSIELPNPSILEGLPRR